MTHFTSKLSHGKSIFNHISFGSSNSANAHVTAIYSKNVAIYFVECDTIYYFCDTQLNLY